MHNGKEVVEMYLERRKIIFRELNRNPRKIDLRLDLPETPYRIRQNDIPTILDIMDNISINSIHAMSGIVKWGDVVMGEWKPDKPHRMSYRVNDSGNTTDIYIEDDGPGINPKQIFDVAAFCPTAGVAFNHEDMPWAVVDYIFRPWVTTKGTNGYGLSNSRSFASLLDGTVYLSGTTYSNGNGLETIGTHNNKNTGTSIVISLPYQSNNGSDF